MLRLNHGGWLDPFGDFAPSLVRLFGPEAKVACTWSPAVDVIETGERVELVADLPGVPQDRISLSFEQGVLTLKAERQAPEASEQVKLTTERPYGTFERAFTLGDELDAEHIEARYEAGVLRVTVPKKPAVKPRRIEVA